MFSYGLWEGVGLFNCWITWAVTKKIYGQRFFPWFGILTMKIFSLAISWYQAKKKFQCLDISLLAAGSLITVPLKIWTVSNIIYPQERNMRIAGYRLSMRRGFWAPCDPSYQEDPKSRPYVASIFDVLGKFCAKVITYCLYSVRKCSCRVTCGVWRRYHFIGSTNQKYLFGWCIILNLKKMAQFFQFSVDVHPHHR